MQITKTTELRATLALAAIFSFRLLGLFMVLPVFTPYAHGLSGATPSNIGLALGIYGLTQAILQIPFGILSDYIGRKWVISAGLVIFAIGSLIAASSTSIHGVIIGRAIQGAGAIGSTIIALVADLTGEERRTRAMALIGLVIGVTFSASMVLGPVLNSFIHVNGIFLVTSLLALLGLIILHTLVPNPSNIRLHYDSQTVPSQLLSVLRNADIVRLDLGILLQHAILTASFVVIPLCITHYLQISSAHQWYVYLPVLASSFVAMVPLIILAEKYRRMKSVFLFAITLIIISQALLWYQHTRLIHLLIGLFIFFTGFNCLEASLPSLISKAAPIHSKGTAMGIYSSAQFLGIFLGGSIGGWLYEQQQLTGVFLFTCSLACLWLLIAFFMHPPRYLSSLVFPIASDHPHSAQYLQQQLHALPGVAEAFVDKVNACAHLKVDKQIFSQESLRSLKV